MKYTAVAYNNIGFINKKGNKTAAIQNYEKALSIQESIGDRRGFRKFNEYRSLFLSTRPARKSFVLLHTRNGYPN